MKLKYKITFIAIAALFIAIIVFFTLSWPKFDNEAYAKVIFDNQYTVYEGEASDESGDHVTVYMQTISNFESSQYIMERTSSDGKETIVSFDKVKPVKEVLPINEVVYTIYPTSVLEKDVVRKYFDIESQANLYQIYYTSVLYFNFDGYLTPIYVIGAYYQDVLYGYMYYYEEFYNGNTCELIPIDVLNGMIADNGLTM